jgi:hypothetical protein
MSGDWRRLHNVELHNLYASPNIVTVIKSRGVRCAGYAAGTDETGNTYIILVRNPEVKKPLGRPRSRLEYNILLLRWLYSPMRTFASLMDFSQSPLLIGLTVLKPHPRFPNC